MCYGGGNLGEDQQVVWNSIACDFASHVGHLTKQVTARTDVVAGTYIKATNKEFKRTVGGRARPERKLTDKVLFTVAATSSLNVKVTPQVSFTTKAAAPW